MGPPAPRPSPAHRSHPRLRRRPCHRPAGRGSRPRRRMQRLHGAPGRPGGHALPARGGRRHPAGNGRRRPDRRGRRGPRRLLREHTGAAHRPDRRSHLPRTSRPCTGVRPVRLRAPGHPLRAPGGTAQPRTLAEPPPALPDHARPPEPRPRHRPRPARTHRRRPARRPPGQQVRPVVHPHRDLRGRRDARRSAGRRRLRDGTLRRGDRPRPHRAVRAAARCRHRRPRAPAELVRRPHRRRTRPPRRLGGRARRRPARGDGPRALRAVGPAHPRRPRGPGRRHHPHVRRTRRPGRRPRPPADRAGHRPRGPGGRGPAPHP